jgi:hypothetical protein
MKLPLVRPARVALAIAAAATAIPLSILVLPRGGTVAVVDAPRPADADQVRAPGERTHAMFAVAAQRRVSPATPAESRAPESRSGARRARARQAPASSVPASRPARSFQQTQVPPPPPTAIRTSHSHGRGHAPVARGQSVRGPSQAGGQTVGKVNRGKHRGTVKGHGRPTMREQGRRAGGPSGGPPKGGHR